MKELELSNDVKDILSVNKQRKLRYRSDLEWLDKWQGLWISDRIRVGVIGVTSSGKSTLINALLGDDLLSVAVRPSSSQLVSCSYAKERSATVYFLNGDKKTVGDTEQLKESIVQYSDESYNQKNEKQVAQLELSTPNFDLGEDVLLVDSPGLDATGYEAHEKLTLETLLPTVDVVIFVTTVKSEIDRKMKQTLDTIAKYNCPVMIVQNMLDSVRASVDGTKSAADVARERMNRVRLAVEQSKIKNKSEVRISQISAAWAMDYRCHKEQNEDIERKFKHSNYESFVSGVKELVQSKRPEVEKQRVSTIIKHVEELIAQENMQYDSLPSAVPADNSLKKASADIKKALSDTYGEIQSVITTLQTVYDKFFSEHKESKNVHFDWGNLFKSALGKKEKSNFDTSLLSSYNDYLGEDEIEEIKRVVKIFETKIVQSVSDFSSKCSEIFKKLNLPARDMWSYNGLPRMPEAQVKTKTVERSRTVKKEGFGHDVLRFITFGIYKGTETEYYTEEVFDEEATRESVKRYIERLRFEYGKTLEAWHTNAKATVSSVRQEIDLRIAAIKEKEQLALDAADWKEIRESLEQSINKYGDKKISLSQNEDEIKPDEQNQEQEVQDTSKLIKVPKKIVQVYMAAEKYLSVVQNSAFNYALQSQQRKNYPAAVVSNSPDNLSDFMYRFYKIEKSDFEKEKVYQLSEELTAVCSPTEKQLKSLQKDFTGINVFLLINGLQFHTEFETRLRHNVQSVLGQNDALFLVIQDFEILTNGNAITECIRSIRIEQESYNGIVLVSHQNPVYNMALIHAQTTTVKLNDETMFYNSLAKHFSVLVNEVTKKNINNILRA